MKHQPAETVAERATLLAAYLGRAFKGGLWNVSTRDKTGFWYGVLLWRSGWAA
jgi:hypothetical protein